MTDHVVRLYALAIAILGFFVAWALVAAHPWSEPVATPQPSAELRQLAVYEQRLARGTALADLLAARRASRAADLAAATAVPVAPRLVTLPPVTETRTS